MMGLMGMALIAANDFMKDFPDAKIISGKRSIAQQATEMAKNTAKDPNFVQATYLPSYAKAKCMEWIERNPKATTDQMAVGLADVLSKMSYSQLAGLSKHLGGMAFDVQPVDTPRGEDIKTGLKALADKHGGKFLEREAGLVRWHLQF